MRMRTPRRARIALPAMRTGIANSVAGGRILLALLVLFCVASPIRLAGRQPQGDEFASTMGSFHERYRADPRNEPCTSLIDQHEALTRQLMELDRRAKASVEPQRRELVRQLNEVAKERGRVQRALFECVRKAHERQAGRDEAPPENPPPTFNVVLNKVNACYRRLFPRYSLPQTKEDPSAISAVYRPAGKGWVLAYNRDWPALMGETYTQFQVAHELGHHVQWLQGNLPGDPATLPVDQAERVEQGADELMGMAMACLAGGDASSRARILSVSERWLKDAADEPGIRGHGTYDQRRRAFLKGFDAPPARSP
jgi:hypothetical protein